MEEYQNGRLKTLITYAYENVPYYHKLFKSLNLKPIDFKSKKDLSKLPVLSKTDIIRNPEEFLIKNIDKHKLIKASTSGSTGKPFEFYMDKMTLSASRAVGLRAWGFAGYRLGDKLATIAGSALLPQKMNLSKRMIFKTNRNLPLSSFNLDNEKVKNYANLLNRFKPKYIRGQPASISKIAKFLLEGDAIGIELKGVMTTAEKLSNTDRKIISEAFNCDVFDHFGCYDGGENLCECNEHSGYHIGVERSIHEFIDQTGEQVSDGEISQIVLTDLWNYSMPLIRYNAGDMAIPSEELCPCGRGLPLVKTVIGRRTEQLTLPGGGLFPSLTITDVFEEENIADKIVEYQIVQEEIDKFSINIIKNNHYEKETSAEITKFFEGHMGIPLRIEFNFVDDIPSTEAGKRKIVISNVKRGEGQ